MTDLDNQLADFTDRLLANPQMKTGGEMSKEEQVILQLHRLFSSEAALDVSTRRKMTQRLNQEWDTTRRTRSSTSNTRLVRQLRPRQIYALAAVIMAALIGVVFILNGFNSSTPDPTGTVSGDFGSDTNALYFVGGFMLAGLLFSAVFYWWTTRQR